jgi:hypothetical protein
LTKIRTSKGCPAFQKVYNPIKEREYTDVVVLNCCKANYHRFCGSKGKLIPHTFQELWMLAT